MSYFDNILDGIGRRLADRLERQAKGYEPFLPPDQKDLRSLLQPADVLLVEGNQKIATAIKYLTQSTWSHAALYIGDALGASACGGEAPTLVEANLGAGVVAAPLSRHTKFNTRICRPVGLTDDERSKVVRFAVARIGHKYDTRNIIDLARYLVPTPPVPVHWRRRMIALGSGEPTRAICSTLIAQAFQSVHYPILPRIERGPERRTAENAYSRQEILHIRHHSLFMPRDFDLSPYFQIIKPTIESGFDHRKLVWASSTLEKVEPKHEDCVPGNAEPNALRRALRDRSRELLVTFGIPAANQ